jgi:long-chain acyl-CoA synthetase
VVCGLHASDPAHQVQDLCAEAGVRVLFVENDEQLDKVLEGRLPALRQIVVFQMEGLRDLRDPRVLGFDELQRRGAQALAADASLVERRLASRAPSDMAALVYTAGSTGRPKGVLLSHANIISACTALRKAWFTGAEEGGERVMFLPLSHTTERVAGAYLDMMLGAVMNFVENAETVFENVREVQPHVFIAVPRVWERLYSTLAIALNDATGLQRWAYARAIGVGQRIAAASERREVTSFVARLQYRLARTLVLDNLRRMMGLDRLRFGVSTSAPVSPELIRWYRAMGVDLREAWGLSEACGIVTVADEASRPGSAGRPIPSVHLSVSERGEILVRGPTVFAGYQGGATQGVDAGWLGTGDLGRIDEAGALQVTDRLRDIMVTSAGHRVAPSTWENRLKFSPYIADAVVVGDGRAHLSCLIMIDHENVEQWAQERQVAFSDFRSLCSSREVVALVAQEVEQVNRHDASGARIEAFHLMDTPPGADEEALTPTLKLKRRRIIEKYADVIERLYAARAA